MFEALVSKTIFLDELKKVTAIGKTEMPFFKIGSQLTLGFSL